MLDENGNPIGPPPPPVYEDAFIPKRLPFVYLNLRGRRLLVHETELRDIMANPFLELDKSRQEAIKANQALYKKAIGTAGEVGTADQLPKWTKGEEKVPTGIVQLDWALKGGIAPGTKIKNWGSNHTWKTTFVFTIAAAFQRYRDRMITENFDRLAAKYGFEPDDETLEVILRNQRILGLVGEDFDPTWAQAQGVDISRLDLIRTTYLEENLDYINANLRKDIDRIQTHFDPEEESWMRAINYPYIFIDSWDSFALYADEHGAGGKQRLMVDNAQVAARASLLSHFWRIASRSSVIPVTIHAIGQQRIKMGAGMAYADGKKGNADAHNTRLEMRHSTNNPKYDLQEITLTFYQVQHPGGMNVGERDSITIVGHRQHGIDPGINLVYTAIDKGIINKSSWLTYQSDQGEKITQQGSDLLAFATKLKEHNLFDEVYRKTMDALYT
ncbi:MAG: hypothetical protein D6698_01595 [Gammaproteobacteria bacterium]|nr:MAG: hypothetical protein D6698_01595 [Gammaproteobacteria bacterium]